MPTIGIQPSLKSTQAIGAVLLHQFARDRFSDAGIDPGLIKEAEEESDELTAILRKESCNAKDANASSDRSVYHSITEENDCTTPLDDWLSTPTFASYGQELRKIAEEFEKDRLRLSVKRKAEKVKLETINKEDFFKLLEDLFQDNITREKIVILFFFCTDVALRAASFAKQLVVKFISWSFSYIINIVCNVVHQLGGWDKVLFHRLPSVLLSCVAALALVSLLVYIRKSLKE